MIPARISGGGECLAVSKVHRLARSAGERGGGGGKLAFVEIIDLHRLAQNRDGLGARRPVEVRTGEQPVITSERREIVTIGIAVTLRIELRGIGGVHLSVTSDFLDVIVQRIHRLAGINPARVVPEQSVIDWRDAGAGLEEVIATTEQREFFIEHARKLTLKGKERGHDIPKDARRFRHNSGRVGDRRIRRVGISLVAEDHIKIVQVTGSEDECVVRGGVVDRHDGVDREILATVQDRLVNLDEAEVIDARQRERDVTFPPGAGLGEQAYLGIHRVIEQVGDTLLEGVDASQGALDPAFRKLWVHPARPGAARRGVSWRAGFRPVAHREVVIRERQQARSLDGMAALAFHTEAEETLRIGRLGSAGEFQPVGQHSTFARTLDPHIYRREGARIGVGVELHGDRVVARQQRASRDFKQDRQRIEQRALRRRERSVLLAGHIPDGDSRLVEIDDRTIALTEREAHVEPERTRGGGEGAAEQRVRQRRGIAIADDDRS